MARAYIGLGANLEDPAAQVREALRRIAGTPGITLVAQSALYRSAPLGPPDQPHYCNAVCAVDTVLEPEALLTALHAIERAMGRVRPPVRWAPRLIDLDLLHFEHVTLQTPRLQLPHREIARRNFVLVPLAEIAPDLAIPGLGRVADLASAAGGAELTRWNAQPV